MKKTTLIAAAIATVLSGAASAETRWGALTTADNDTIEVWHVGNTGNGNVRVCLKTYSGQWKKDLRIDNVGTLRAEGGTTDCLEAGPQFMRLEMIKAKFGGVMTGVGYGNLDLANAGGSIVEVRWIRD